MSSVPKPTAPTEMDVEMQVFDDSSGGGVASSSENSESSASDASEINVVSICELIEKVLIKNSSGCWLH